MTFSAEKELIEQADLLFSELGMSVSTALNIFLRQAVREQQLPFAVTKNVPNAITLSAIEAAERDEDVYGPFDSVQDLMEALNAET